MLFVSHVTVTPGSKIKETVEMKTLIKKKKQKTKKNKKQKQKNKQTKIEYVK